MMGMVVALGAPFAVVVAGQAAIVDSAASAAVASLLRVTEPLATPPPAKSEAQSQSTSWVQPAVALGAASAAAPAKAGRKRPPPPAAPTGVFVSARRVLELANARVEPRGSFVPSTAEHPAGLRLSGVAALGIGVEDGDILIEALGVAPRSSGDIIGAVIQARAARARYLSGTLWRRGQTLRITVEQPYLEP
jgi:hypothetical protein